MIDLVRKADAGSYSISIASHDVSNVSFRSDCCQLKAYLDKCVQKNIDLAAIMQCGNNALSPTVHLCLQQCQQHQPWLKELFIC